MSGATPAAVSSREPLLDAAFGDLWPEHAVAGRPRLLAAALAVGLLGAVVLPFREPGLGTFLVLVAMSALVVAADTRRATPYHLTSALLCLLLISTVVVRDAFWVVALCLMAAFAVASAALVDARSVTGLLASWAAVPLAGLRGLPWLGRSARPRGLSMPWLPAVRTALVSVVLVVVFGALFASADAVFADWAGALLPHLTASTAVLRGFVWAAVAGVTTAGVYVAVNPLRVERLALPAGTPVARRFEWLVPVGVVVTVFAVFVTAQAAALFGGHAYLRRTTGLTYAEYVHQGFGQLTVATLLTLGVVAAASRKAPRATAQDRLLLRLVLGALSGLALVVVGSALYRMHLYEQAYGFTRLRLLVSVFEAWLGLLVVLVLVAGATFRAGWLPRAALLSGAGLLLALAAANPDAYIARHNLARFEQTGRADWGYLAGLSDDAAPTLSSLPGHLRGRVAHVDRSHDDWLEWNLGRARARGGS